MSLVSVIITCFNSQETIKRAVKSALRQNWEDLEIIIIDDCSTDSSFKILSEISNKDSRISLYRHDSNLGYPAALNTGIRNAKGEFIAIFDDDDENKNNRISKQVSRIIEFERKNKNSITLCYSNRNIYKRGELKSDHTAFAIGRKEPVPKGIEVAEFILGMPVNINKAWGMFGSCTLMFRRNMINKIGFFDEKFRRTSEWDFAIRASFKGAYFIAVDEPLVNMYKTSGSDKAGKIPLIYSLKLREKYKKFLKKRRFYYASRQIAKSNFYINKKQRIIGIYYRILALLLSPILLINFLKKISLIKKLIKK